MLVVGIRRRKEKAQRRERANQEEESNDQSNSKFTFQRVGRKAGGQYALSALFATD